MTAGTKTASGIRPNTENRTFEVALSLALNPETVLTPNTLAAELGITSPQAQEVCRQLVHGQIAERIGHGRYQATVGLKRMVRLWTPGRDGPST